MAVIEIISPLLVSLNLLMKSCVDNDHSSFLLGFEPDEMSSLSSLCFPALSQW